MRRGRRANKGRFEGAERQGNQVLREVREEREQNCTDPRARNGLPFPGISQRRQLSRDVQRRNSRLDRQEIRGRYRVRGEKESYKKGSSVMVRGAKCWSHKRGTAFPPTLQDSTGSIIKDPRTAKFDYGVLNYTVFCTAFCVKQRDDMKAPIFRTTTNGELNVKKYDRRYTGLKSVIKAVKKRIGMKK